MFGLHGFATHRLLPGRLAIVALVMLGGFGCSSTTPEDDADAPPRIALVMKSLANEFFATMAEGAEAYHQERPNQFELVVNGIKDERDISRQVALVEEMIASGVDAIVIAPADSKALAPVCKRALAAGIVVVNIDNKFDRDVLADAAIEIPFVGPDNRAGARQVADVLAAQLEAGDQVAILEGAPNAFNAIQRKLGFVDSINQHELNLIDSQSGQWEMGVANQVASAMIAAHADLKAFLCSNDSMALGALAAVRSAGKIGEIAIVGFDNVSAVRQPIRDGHIVATADQHADQLAVYGIEFALQILDGAAAPDDKETPVDLITQAELGESL